MTIKEALAAAAAMPIDPNMLNMDLEKMPRETQPAWESFSGALIGLEVIREGYWKSVREEVSRLRHDLAAEMRQQKMTESFKAASNLIAQVRDAVGPAAWPVCSRGRR